MLDGGNVTKRRNTVVVRNDTQVYAPQTKSLEGLTKDEIQIFDILFNG